MQQEDALYPVEQGFAPAKPTDEFLHPVSSEADHTLSETSYFGFNVPEANIDCEIYHWFHPNLRVTSGGLMIFQGHKRLTTQADYFDYRNFLPYPDGDIGNIEFPTGIRIKVIKPLELIEITFRAPDGAAAFDLECRAIMPAAGRIDGTHFVQAMKCTGELTLRGTRHKIDSYFTRDRSYCLPRSEEPHAVGPLTWGAAVFGSNLAFHFVGADSDELTEQGVRWGYVWCDGTLRKLVRMRKRTLRSADGTTQSGAEIDLEDGEGALWRLRATCVALMPMPFWPNMVTNLGLMRYELADGRVGYGDFQDVQFGHFLRKMP